MLYCGLLEEGSLQELSFWGVALLSTDSSSASPVLASLVLLLVQKGIITKWSKTMIQSLTDA